MIGRRLPSEGKTYTMPEQAGDYSGPVDIGDGKTAVYFLLPGHNDPSKGQGHIWHGYLDEGHSWRTV